MLHLEVKHKSLKLLFVALGLFSPLLTESSLFSQKMTCIVKKKKKNPNSSMKQIFQTTKPHLS